MRFVVDSMLGKLAKWLRILGFDTRFESIHSLEQFDAYRAGGFLLITRNRRWSGQARTFCLTVNDPLEQLREIAARVPIKAEDIRLLQRCIRCNAMLREIPRDQVPGLVPDYVFETHSSFHQCPQCLRLFWPGSHPERMIERLRRELGWNFNAEDSEANPPSDIQAPRANS